MTPRTARRALACAALLALAGCGGEAHDEQAPGAAATPAPAAETVAAVPQDAIPPAMRGRWGLVAADCEPGRADAKGLMVVSAEQLEFYESVGRLDDVETAAADRLVAEFAFSGEGMTWDRAMTLALEDGGGALVRRESGEDAMEGPLRYERCPGTGA